MRIPGMKRAPNVIPKGFDISLQHIFEKYEVTAKDLETLRDAMGKDGNLAYAIIGNDSFYRTSQIDNILTKKKV